MGERNYSILLCYSDWQYFSTTLKNLKTKIQIWMILENLFDYSRSLLHTFIILAFYVNAVLHYSRNTYTRVQKVIHLSIVITVVLDKFFTYQSAFKSLFTLAFLSFHSDFQRVQKPHYEAAAEQVSEKEPSIELTNVDKTEEAKVVVNGGGDATDAVVCPATIDDSSVTTEAAVAAALASKRKLSLDSRDASSIGKSKKINKRTLSMGSPEESIDITMTIANGVDENSDDANDDVSFLNCF